MARPTVGNEAANGLARFGIVCDGNLVLEVARQHLPPGGPGLFVLVDHCGISSKINRRHIGELYFDGSHAGMSARELKRQLLVPDRKSTRLNSSHLGISYAV